MQKVSRNICFRPKTKCIRSKQTLPSTNHRKCLIWKVVLQFWISFQFSFIFQRRIFSSLVSFFSQFEAVWQQLVVWDRNGSRPKTAPLDHGWSWALYTRSTWSTLIIWSSFLQKKSRKVKNLIFSTKIGVQSPTRLYLVPTEIRVKQKLKKLATLDKNKNETFWVIFNLLLLLFSVE